jgi:hypothetical protein
MPDYALMATLSLVLLYGGVFVGGTLAIVVAMMLTTRPSDSPALEHRPRSDDEVDPIRTLSF